MSEDTEAGGAGWLDDEIVSEGLPDKRLARQLHRLLDQMWAVPGQSVPAACNDWAATKATFLFFNGTPSVNFRMHVVRRMQPPAS